MTIVEAVKQADRRWLASHPLEAARYRDLVEGEFASSAEEHFHRVGRHIEDGLPEGWHINLWVRATRAANGGVDRSPLFIVERDEWPS